MSVMRPTVWVDPTQVEDPDQVAARLAPLLGLDAAVVRAKATGDGKARYRLLARAVTTDVGKQVRDLEEPGVYATDSFARVKLSGNLARSVVGATDADGKGISGLELARNQQLQGVDGSVRYERAERRPHDRRRRAADHAGQAGRRPLPDDRPGAAVRGRADPVGTGGRHAGQGRHGDREPAEHR